MNRRQADRAANGSTGLKRFYVVTATSLYEVSDQGHPENRQYPMAQKIAIRPGVNSEIPVGSILGPGSTIGITHFLGLVSYNRSDNRLPSQTHTEHFAPGHSSPITALFVDLRNAQKCLRSVNLQPWDARWHDQTQQVLTLIGDDHPVFAYDRHQRPS